MEELSMKNGKMPKKTKGTKAEELFSLIFTTVEVESVSKVGQSLPDRFTCDDDKTTCLICSGPSPLREISNGENSLLVKANLWKSLGTGKEGGCRWVCRLCSKVLVKWATMERNVIHLLGQIEDLVNCVKFTMDEAVPSTGKEEDPGSNAFLMSEGVTDIGQQRSPSPLFLPCNDDDDTFGKGSPLSDSELGFRFTEDEDKELNGYCLYPIHSDNVDNDDYDVMDVVKEEDMRGGEEGDINDNSFGILMDSSSTATPQNDYNVNIGEKYHADNSGVSEEDVEVVIQESQSCYPESTAEKTENPPNNSIEMQLVDRPKRKSRVKCEEKMMSIISMEAGRGSSVEDDEDEECSASGGNQSSESESEDESTEEISTNITKQAENKPVKVKLQSRKRKRGIKSEKKPKKPKQPRPDYTEKRNELIDLRRARSNTKCDECGKIFTSVIGLFSHHKQQHETLATQEDGEEERKFCCSLCPKKYFHASTLDIHTRIMHRKGRDGKHFCMICKKSFEDYKDFKNHKAEDCSGIPAKCDECGKKFSQRTYLYDHHKSRHENKNEGDITCETCGQRFKTQDTLAVHNKLFHEELKYRNTENKCRICGLKFPNRKELFTHQLTCKPDYCELCDFECVRVNLSRHEKSAMHKIGVSGKRVLSNGEIKFVCYACPETFGTVRQLRSHLAVAHGKGNGPIKCNTCDTSYKTLEFFKQHLKSVRHKKNEICSRNLDATEVQERVFPCSKCHKTFTTFEDLNLHENKTHSSVYICETCGSVFKTKRGVASHQFMMHRAVKTKDRPQTEKGEPDRKHCCKLCPKKFAQISNLRSHVRLKHWGLKFTCHCCKASFNSVWAIGKLVETCDLLKTVKIE